MMEGRRGRIVVENYSGNSGMGWEHPKDLSCDRNEKAASETSPPNTSTRCIWHLRAQRRACQRSIARGCKSTCKWCHRIYCSLRLIITTPIHAANERKSLPLLPRRATAQVSRCFAKFLLRALRTVPDIVGPRRRQNLGPAPNRAFGQVALAHTGGSLEKLWPACHRPGLPAG